MLSSFGPCYVNAETRRHEEYFADLMGRECPMTKLDAVGDTRLIPGGRFLRASGWMNCRKFSMFFVGNEFVGPGRACPGNSSATATGAAASRRVAGLTGYWQVNGKNNTTFKEMIAMDLFTFGTCRSGLI